MNCEELRIQISAFVDQNLEPEWVPVVQRHLASCPSCLTFYQEQRELARYLQNLENTMEPPPTIWQHIELKTLPPAGFGWVDIIAAFRRPVLQYALSAALAMGLASLAIFNLGPGPQSDPSMLAELEAYNLEVQGNPFLPAVGPENPFFQPVFARTGNPFRSTEK